MGKKKPTRMAISASGYWNGATTVIEPILSKAHEAGIDLKRFYCEWSDEPVDIRTTKFGSDTYIHTSSESIYIDLASRTECKRFLREFIFPSASYNDHIDETVKDDVWSVDFYAREDDAPFEEGEYMSDGMYYTGRY